MACAAADMLARRALGVDLVLLIEGEEEAGSGGFVETVKRHKVRRLVVTYVASSKDKLQDAIGSIDAILVR